MKTLCRKQVELAIKSHQSDQALMSSFGLDEETFNEKMSIIYSAPMELAQKMRKLRSNRKTDLKPLKHKYPAKAASPREPKTELELLEEREQALCEAIAKSTENLQTLKAQDDKVLNDISEVLDEIKRLYRRQKTLEAKIKNLQAREEEIVRSYNGGVSAHIEKENQLAEVRNRIKSAKKIVVYFYNFDHIESPQPLSTDGWKEIKAELEEKPELQEVSVLQLKNLAHIAAIKQNSIEEIEFVFDDSKLEEFLKYL